MTRYSFDWVDAFTDTPFGGNGCVVVHDAAGLSVEQRLALVRETSLSECAYLVGSEVADFGARYYLADKEILMAGHPTIATVTSLLHRGMVALTDGRASFTLEVGAGVLPIDVEVGSAGTRITMTQAKPVFGRTYSPGQIAPVYGLSADDIVGTPQTVSTGTPFCITVLRDHDALRRAVLDTSAFSALRADADFMEPYLVTLQGASEQGRTFSRLLLPPPMPAEDPFTGSATGCMVAYVWHHGMVDTPAFIAEQGHWLGRPGQAFVEALGPREAPTGIKVAGSGVVLMDGALIL